MKSALVFFPTTILFVFPSSPLGIPPVVLAFGSLIIHFFTFKSDDVEVFTREEVERAHVRFYSDLFTDEPIDAVFKQRCL